MKQIKSHIVCCLTFFIFSCKGYAQTKKEIFPMKTVLGRPAVEVFVNGKGPFLFSVDLGASGIGRINQPLDTVFHFPKAATSANSDGINTAQANQVRVDKIQLGSISVENTDLIMRDYRAPMAGILGREFFQDKTLTVDYLRQEVIISNEPLRPTIANVASYTKPFWIKGKVCGKDAELNLDSGSSGGIVFPKSFLTDNKIPFTPTGNIIKSRRANTELELVEVVINGPIEIAGHFFTNLTVQYNEQLQAINVGSGILKQFSISIDQKNQLVKLSK